MSRVARSPRRSADANPVASAPARRRRLSKEERWEEILVVAEQVFSDLMGDKVEPRKQFITNNARDVDVLDV